ncbi:MAG: prepilin-type N-terminal cleavage/methylation domain-containing protein [Lentisphaeria bacterium]|nr:prepilin-type N-terminal cleavage/methylation domain-containing protein [Lentisphaeria bacterium]
MKKHPHGLAAIPITTQNVPCFKLKQRKHIMKKQFTLIELLVVIAIITILPVQNF